MTSPPNIGLVRSLGADHVVDYTTTDFARSGRRYDLILDTVGNRSVPDLRRALAGGGKAAVTGFTSAAMLIRVSLRGGAGPGGRWSEVQHQRRGERAVPHRLAKYDVPAVEACEEPSEQ